MYCTAKGSLSQCQAVAGGDEHLQQKFTSNAGKDGQIGVFERVYPTMPFMPLN